MTSEILMELNIVIPLIFSMVGLLLVVLIDPYIRRRHRKVMIIIVAMVSVLILDDYIGFYVAKIEPNQIIRIVTSIIGYTLRPAIIVMFCYVVDVVSKHILEWVLVIFNMIVHMTSLFSDICFTITPDNMYVRGPLGFTSHIVSVILLVRFVWLIIRSYSNVSKREVFVQLFNVILIIIAAGLDSFGGDIRFLQVPLLLPTIVICSVLQYIWLHLQYVREHERDIIDGQRMRMMVSQAQPHFIYNSLTVIKAYLNEPDKAEEALDNFTGFLRGSIDMLSSTQCIEFQKELDTVNHYLYLAGERFGDKLTIILDTRDTDYKLPAFTIQALVENAISHGIRKNKGGRGTLTIKTYRDDRMHVIEVTDDGAGFDVDKYFKDVNKGEDTDGRSHIGLLNVKSRLEYMCDGTMVIESELEKGTKVVVRIPSKTM